MDNDKISKDAAKTIIIECKNGVNWCDGNSYEAISYIGDCMCGRCMRKIPEGEKLYSVYDVSNDIPRRYDISDNIANDSLCTECFDIVLNEHCNARTKIYRGSLRSGGIY